MGTVFPINLTDMGDRHPQGLFLDDERKAKVKIKLFDCSFYEEIETKTGGWPQ